MNVELYQEGEVKAELKDGQLVFTYGGKGAHALFSVDMGYVLDKIAAAIPGQVDDAIIGVIKAAIKAN
jgi:hypothetical protein